MLLILEAKAKYKYLSRFKSDYLHVLSSSVRKKPHASHTEIKEDCWPHKAQLLSDIYLHKKLSTEARKIRRVFHNQII